MTQASDRVVLGDIGGTNARFALLQVDQLTAIETLPVAGYGEVAEALEAFLSAHREKAPIVGAVLAIAGPVEQGRGALTNASWVIDAAELSRKFGWARVKVVNDFEAIAWAVPHLSPADLMAIGGGRAKPGAPAVAIGPGTGLGLACVVPGPGGTIVLGTEGGHATMPGTSPREDAIIDHLRGHYGHVSLERVLSGGGLVNLYHAIVALDRVPLVERTAAEITAAALDGSCPICREVLDRFWAMLGTVAGDVALDFAARGGVYIAGGIVPRLVDDLTRSQFRARFEAKGRFSAYLAAIPSWVVTHPEPAFIGLQAVARQEFG